MGSDNRYVALGLKGNQVYLLDTRNDLFLRGRRSKPTFVPSISSIVFNLVSRFLFLIMLLSVVPLLFLSEMLSSAFGDRSIICGIHSSTCDKNSIIVLLFACVLLVLAFDLWSFKSMFVRFKHDFDLRRCILANWTTSSLIAGQVIQCTKEVDFSSRARLKYMELHCNYQVPATNNIEAVRMKCPQPDSGNKCADIGAKVIIIYFPSPIKYKSKTPKKFLYRGYSPIVFAILVLKSDY